MLTMMRLEDALRNALSSLYDPTYEPEAVLYEALGCDPQDGPPAVQAALLRLIRELKPGADVPHGARAMRLYEILCLRYVQQQTQEAVAEELAITPRHLRREQQRAIALLAQRIMRAYVTSRPDAGDMAETSGATTPEGDGALDAWLSQIKQEVACLRKETAGVAANVSEALAGARGITSGLAARHGVALRVHETPPHLTALIHPAALRQVLVAGIAELVRQGPLETVELGAAARNDVVEITITGDAPSWSSDDHLMRELLSAHHGSLEVRTHSDRVELIVTLPSARTIAVLVIDDNDDLVHFYRRYTADTRYSITHLSEGGAALEVVETLKPDVIVLDVMLPDVDGWELLSHLHEYPASREIPVVVCSVVREEELALALGAFSYLPKPVRRQELLEALGQAASRAASTGPRSSASSSTAC